MPKNWRGRADLAALLDAVEAASPVHAVDVLARELSHMLAATGVRFLIADLSGDTLIAFEPSPGEGSRGADAPDGLVRVPLAGSQHERALTSQQVVVEHGDDGERLFAPVTDRGDAIGVLELALPPGLEPGVVAGISGFVASAARALAYVVIANRRHTDLFERGQRNVPFSLAAEIQRRLLPDSFTCEAAEFTLAGWLEPSSDVGGDTFDYNLEAQALHLSISDARGHTVAAAQLATLAVGALRNSRRVHASIVEQAQAANRAITAHSSEEDFVSALLLRVDLASGVVTAVNAGHPTPFISRDGDVSAVRFEADPPLGMLPETRYRRQTLTLQPGDRLVLLTDGMLERRAALLDVRSALRDSTASHPREVVRAFAQALLGSTGGTLEDDATVLCLDWYGPQPAALPRQRDRDRAPSPA
jgi:hypothetical protein